MNATPAKVNVCRLCSSAASKVVLSLKGMPRWNHRLLREAELRTDRPIDLNVYQCASCGFVSTPVQLADDYYDDYVNAPSLSAQMQEFQTAQADEFFRRFQLKGKSVLEIGCGDGFFLAALAAHGAVCTGVEPSELQRSIALGRNLHVEVGILSPDRQLARGPFDAFVTRQVFEHIENMTEFLGSIRKNLRAAAVGLVEVPNLEKLIAEGRFFDFIPEHVNYFSPDSLRLALELGGFEMLEILPVQDGESLRAFVRSKQQPSFAGIERCVGEMRESIARFIADRKSRGERVAIWGAGGKGLSMLAVSDLAGVDILVDGDPHKLGRFTPVSHLRVCSPQELRGLDIGAVIITAPAYQHEILRILRDEYRFTGTVAVIENGLKLSER